jgi:hypothetical protein
MNSLAKDSRCNLVVDGLGLDLEAKRKLLDREIFFSHGLAATV